ncbi:MAG: hypothetical protein H0X47_10035 [Nitrospirales bacterium]|nr:hypothetical protein [Nitrospirales bacterium]
MPRRLTEVRLSKEVENLTPQSHQHIVEGLILPIGTRIKNQMPVPSASKVGYDYQTWNSVMLELWRNT